MATMELSKEYRELEETIAKYKDTQGALMPIMHKAQELFGYIDEEIQMFISERANVPLSKIYGVATFYTQFTLEPRGKYNVAVCLGTACYVRGAQKVFDAFSGALGIGAGGKTEDSLFSLEATRCIGCCGLAPALMVNDEVYGRLTPADAPAILEKYKKLG